MGWTCKGHVALVTALAAWVIVTGCRPGPGRPRPGIPERLPSAEDLVRQLAERRERIVSVRGFAQISYESGDDNLGSRHAVLVSRPDHFRLEVLSPFGALAVVASNGKELVVYARRENRLYRGAATPGSMAAYTSVPVDVHDVVTLLLGGPPERRPTAAGVVTADAARGLVRLSLPLEVGRQDVWFAPDTLWPVASETPLTDGRTLRLDFTDYRQVGAVAFPHRIDMRAEPGDGAVRVRYSSPSLNVEVADALFSFPPRPGVEEFTIEQYPTGAPAS